MLRVPKEKPLPWDGAVVAVVILCAVLSLCLRVSGTVSGVRNLPDSQRGKIADSVSLWAVVYMDGRERDRVGVDTGEAQEERIYQNYGYTLHVLFRPEGETAVEVSQSDCPTQICYLTGRISRPGQTIICLPSQIVIRLESSAPDSDAPDAVLK